MPMLRTARPAQFAARLVTELSPERISGLPAPWVQARRGFQALGNVPLRQVKTAERTKDRLVQSIVDDAAAGKPLNGKLDVAALLAAEGLDHQVDLVNGLFRDAQKQGRVTLVLSTYDQHKAELIKAVQTTFGTVTKRLWTETADEDLTVIDPDVANQVGGQVAATMLRVFDLCREAEALSELTRLIEDKGGWADRELAPLLRWTRTRLVADARLRYRALDLVSLGGREVTLGEPMFWLLLTKVAPLDTIWCPTIADCEQRAQEITDELARTRPPTGQVPPGMLAAASRADT